MVPALFAAPQNVCALTFDDVNPISPAAIRMKQVKRIAVNALLLLLVIVFMFVGFSVFIL
jgi:hypothetical protein